VGGGQGHGRWPIVGEEGGRMQAEVGVCPADGLDCVAGWFGECRKIL
jgi:hypothetical protein